MNYFVYQGLLVCFLLFLTYYRLQKKQKQTDLAFNIGWNLALNLMVMGFIGGRLLHVIYESPWIYINNPLQILKFWQGGFVFFGGFILALSTSWLYLHYKKENFLLWADFYSPIVAIGYALGRIGCLIAGCCYGGYCDLPWAMDGRHPTQAYAFCYEILVAIFLLNKERTTDLKKSSGIIFSYWLIAHGFGRILMENFRDDFRGPVPLGFSLGTWISFLVITLGSFIFLKIKNNSSDKSW